MRRSGNAYRGQKAKIYWPDPNIITCQNRYFSKDVTKPWQTSPHKFGVGNYVLHYIYHLYGGHDVTCNVYVTISKRAVRVSTVRRVRIETKPQVRVVRIQPKPEVRSDPVRGKYSVYTVLSDVNRTIIFFILHN